MQTVVTYQNRTYGWAEVRRLANATKHADFRLLTTYHAYQGWPEPLARPPRHVVIMTDHLQIDGAHVKRFDPNPIVYSPAFVATVERVAALCDTLAADYGLTVCYRPSGQAAITIHFAHADAEATGYTQYEPFHLTADNRLFKAGVTSRDYQIEITSMSDEAVTDLLMTVLTMRPEFAYHNQLLAVRDELSAAQTQLAELGAGLGLALADEPIGEQIRLLRDAIAFMPGGPVESALSSHFGQLHHA